MQISGAFNPIAASRARELLGLKPYTDTIDIRFPIPFAAVDANAQVTYVRNSEGTVTSCTVTGLDNADAINAYDALCAARGVEAYLPPGDYVCHKQLYLTANWKFDGTIYFPNNNGGQNSNGTYKVPNRPSQKIWIGGEDRFLIAFSEWSAWRGTNKGSAFISGMARRKGQYITIDTSSQNLLQRGSIMQDHDDNPATPDEPVPRDPLRMGEGFLVADDEGRLGNILYGTMNNHIWPDDNKTVVTCERLKSRITLRNLRVVIFDAGGTETIESIVYCNRSNVTFSHDSLINLSGRPIAQMHNATRCANVLYDSSYVNGAHVVGTNYGFNSGLCVNITYLNVTAIYCRRGMDAHRSKCVRVMLSYIGDGVGGHWCYDMVVEASTVGGGTSANAQAFQCAGGDFTVRGCTVALHGSASQDSDIAMFAVRGDGFECDGFVTVENCNISFSGAYIGRDYVLFRAIAERHLRHR